MIDFQYYTWHQAKLTSTIASLTEYPKDILNGHRMGACPKSEVRRGSRQGVQKGA